MESLEGRSVIVTGGAGGIGLACVEAFLGAGARVTLADVDPAGRDRVEQLASDRCRFAHTDVSDERCVQDLIGQTVAAFGSLDVLVNNAAVLTPCAPVHETTLDQFEALVAVNVRGLFLCCKHAYPELKRSGGSIVNLSSMAGVTGEKHHAVYAATKGAINALTRSMAADYGPEGIRVNAVCPSCVETPRSERAIAASPDADTLRLLRRKIIPLGSVARPDQVASVVVFLASPAAAFITGAVIPVSGGSECGYGLKY